jgi:ATP phosphoribosyltransferase
VNEFTIVCAKGELAKDTESFLQEKFRLKVDLNSKKYVENIGDYRIVKVRSWDVPQVTELVGDYGITGSDIFENYKLLRPSAKLELMGGLGYGSGDLYLMAKKPLSDIKEPVRVATRYEGLTKKFFDEMGKKVEINKSTFFPMIGSIEASPELDLADAIVDVVFKGQTSDANGVRRLQKVMSTSAVMFRKVK